MNYPTASAALTAAAHALDEYGVEDAVEPLRDAAELIANLETAFRLRTGAMDQMRERLEVLEGQVLLLEHAVSSGRET